MLEGVTIEQLRTLRAVVSEGSFTAAARRLGRVQAAVSQAIDRLEAQLGLKLFDRSGRVPRLTAHGQAVAAAASRVEERVEALEEIVTSLKRGAERSLRIVVDVLFPTDALVTFAKEFEAEHPGVELVLFTDVLSAVTAHVREKRSSWGIAVEDADLGGLEWRAIASVRLVSVVAADHALAKVEGPIARSVLSDAVQIVLGEHRLDGESGSDRHGVLSPRTWRVVDLATKRAFIVSGLGFGHMPEHIIQDDLHSGRLVPLTLETWGARELRRSIVLVRRPEAVMGPVATWAEARLGELCRHNTDSGPPIT